MTLEFALSDRMFDAIRELVREETGISLSHKKREMVYSRLAKRIRALGLSSFGEYLDRVSLDIDERESFRNAITTNLTQFFREKHHFEFLRSHVIPEWSSTRPTRRVRLWSAGCSTGEEPYSLSMTLHDHLPAQDGWDVRILATDIDSSVLSRARAGVYDESRLEGLPEDVLSRWFRKGRGSQLGKVRIDPRLQSLIAFRELNLIGPWPMRGPFDVIFCRNVVIYFDKDTQRRLFERYANLLAPDGLLFIGHSESLYRVSDRFELLGQSTYRRIR